MLWIWWLSYWKIVCPVLRSIIFWKFINLYYLSICLCVYPFIDLYCIYIYIHYFNYILLYIIIYCSNLYVCAFESNAKFSLKIHSKMTKDIKSHGQILDKNNNSFQLNGRVLQIVTSSWKVVPSYFWRIIVLKFYTKYCFVELTITFHRDFQVSVGKSCIIPLEKVDANLQLQFTF